VGDTPWRCCRSLWLGFLLLFADVIAVALFISEYRRKRRAKLIESRPSAPTAREVEHHEEQQAAKPPATPAAGSGRKRAAKPRSSQVRFEETSASWFVAAQRLTHAMQPSHVYKVRPRKDHRGVDLISDALPFGRLWCGQGSNEP